MDQSYYQVVLLPELTCNFCIQNDLLLCTFLYCNWTNIYHSFIICKVCLPLSPIGYSLKSVFHYLLCLLHVFFFLGLLLPAMSVSYFYNLSFYVLVFVLSCIIRSKLFFYFVFSLLRFSVWPKLSTVCPCCILFPIYCLVSNMSLLFAKSVCSVLLSLSLLHIFAMSNFVIC